MSTAPSGLAECLIKPPPQLYGATSQLADSAAAVEAGDHDTARDALLSIDLNSCRVHWTACGSEGLQRHQKERHRRGRRGKRVAVSPTMRIQIGERDGWRCRYCALPLVWDGFFKTVYALFMDIEDSMNDLWRIFAQSPDHVIPFAAEGQSVPANVVSACGACNYSKSDCLLEELGLEDPRSRAPIRDGWTGLVGRPHAGAPSLEAL